MTSDEKLKHPWSCDLRKGDVQCPYGRSNGSDGSWLHCGWKEGHSAELGHQSVYNGDDSGRNWEPIAVLKA